MRLESKPNRHQFIIEFTENSKADVTVVKQRKKNIKIEMVRLGKQKTKQKNPGFVLEPNDLDLAQKTLQSSHVCAHTSTHTEPETVSLTPNKLKKPIPE